MCSSEWPLRDRAEFQRVAWNTKNANQECKCRRFLGEVRHSCRSCWDPQRARALNKGFVLSFPRDQLKRTALSAQPRCLSREKNVTIYKMKGYLQGMKE